MTKHRYSECCKIVVCWPEIGPKRFGKLKPEPGPNRKAQPDLTTLFWGVPATFLSRMFNFYAYSQEVDKYCDYDLWTLQFSRFLFLCLIWVRSSVQLHWLADFWRRLVFFSVGLSREIFYRFDYLDVFHAQLHPRFCSLLCDFHERWVVF